MRAETLKDVLIWTKDFHQHMASRLTDCADRHGDQRASLLLQYLAEHEQTLTETADRYTSEGNQKALDTWCYDHIDQSAIVYRDLCNTDFATMDVDSIIKRVAEEHDEIVSLYRYLKERAEIPEAEELMDEMLSLEEHEVMLMMQAANRLQDV